LLCVHLSAVSDYRGDLLCHPLSPETQECSITDSAVYHRDVCFELDVGGDRDASIVLTSLYHAQKVGLNPCDSAPTSPSSAFMQNICILIAVTLFEARVVPLNLQRYLNSVNHFIRCCID
jgi:hypothetical protein